MTLWDTLIHLLNFAAPALVLAFFLPLAARLLFKKQKTVFGLTSQTGINFAVGLTVLAIGLWVFGRDGKLSTYTALVLAMASSQWVLMRGWRD